MPETVGLFAVLLLLASQTDTVSAQGMLVPNRNILKINRALKKVLNAELHFVKKICNPTDEQFAAIHRAGLDEVNELAQLFAIQQRVLTKTQDILDPNARISSALSDAVRAVIPDRESADRYAEEIKARSESRRAATAGMIVTVIDQHAFLDPAQQDSLAAALLENSDSELVQRAGCRDVPNVLNLAGCGVTATTSDDPATKAMDLSTCATQRTVALGFRVERRQDAGRRRTRRVSRFETARGGG